ncbi:MAG TPA: BLUF domain-containing protein [Pseudorhizobium sp.]|jgi:hypothetical protein|nr:BLUF domain-containing protein [Pseudorhizobium sp.]
MPLYRLLYRSEIALTGSKDQIDHQIDQIVSASEQSNARSGLTGALIASGGVFIQALEGPLGALEATFEKICLDLRHKRVNLIELAAAEERIFPEWSMIRVAQGAQMIEICTVVGVRESGRLDTSTTSALVSLMRNILLTKSTSSPGDEVAAGASAAYPAP